MEALHFVTICADLGFVIFGGVFVGRWLGDRLAGHRPLTEARVREIVREEIAATAARDAAIALTGRTVRQAEAECYPGREPQSAQTTPTFAATPSRFPDDGGRVA